MKILEKILDRCYISLKGYCSYCFKSYTGICVCSTLLNRHHYYIIFLADIFGVIHLVRTQKFTKNQYFLPLLHTRTYECVSRGEKCYIFGKPWECKPDCVEIDRRTVNVRLLLIKLAMTCMFFSMEYSILNIKKDSNYHCVV